MFLAGRREGRQRVSSEYAADPVVENSSRNDIDSTTYILNGGLDGGTVPTAFLAGEAICLRQVFIFSLNKTALCDDRVFFTTVDVRSRPRVSKRCHIFHSRSLGGRF